MEYSFDDTYMNHRRKFILKLRDYICQDEENNKSKKGSSSLGESTSTESNNNLNMNKNLKFIEDNEKNDEKDSEENNNIFNQEEIHIENNDDY